MAYKHPDFLERDYALDLYKNMVAMLHCTPETEAQMDLRLGEKKTGFTTTEWTPERKRAKAHGAPLDPRK